MIKSITNVKSTEFAVLGALEYVQFVNRRTPGMRQIIHGVNISMSIPHEVRTYACGATPVCVGCDNLVGAGVVVVVAARATAAGTSRRSASATSRSASITDPGNAEEVITVGATHRDKPHTYGVSLLLQPRADRRRPLKPDLVAPGEKIESGPCSAKR